MNGYNRRCHTLESGLNFPCYTIDGSLPTQHIQTLQIQPRTIQELVRFAMNKTGLESKHNIKTETTNNI